MDPSGANGKKQLQSRDANPGCSLLALKEYITGTERARFVSFASRNKKNIPEWSMKINATSAHDLHGTWIQQYDTLQLELKNSRKRSTHTQICNTALWNDIYENFKRRKTSIDTFHEEAIRALTTVARPMDIEKFYQMQQYVFDFTSSNNLTLESDIHLILTLNSILLLQNNNRLHKAMVPLFGNKLYTRIREHNLDSWSLKNKFPGDILLKAIEISQSLREKTTYRIDACAAMFNLASTMEDKIDKCLIVSSSQLLQYLPVDPTNTHISEAMLITRYIVPLLQPLFDNDDLNIQLDFMETKLAEKYQQPPNSTGAPG